MFDMLHSPNSWAASPTALSCYSLKIKIKVPKADNIGSNANTFSVIAKKMDFGLKWIFSVLALQNPLNKTITADRNSVWQHTVVKALKHFLIVS